MHYEMLTGPFIGQIVEEGYTFIIGQKFEDLDEDMKGRVRDYAQRHSITNMEDAIELYEQSWESVEV